MVMACMALAMMVGCSKQKLVTEPCQFDVRLDWVGGTKMQFSVSPDNPDAYYTYGMIKDEDFVRFTESEIVGFQLDYMEGLYQAESYVKKPESPFSDMFCFKGERTIRVTQLTPGTAWHLLLFQLNPETREKIGQLYDLSFESFPVPKEDMQFKIVCSGNKFTIIPSDLERTWFWEYESEDKLMDVYESPFFFYYSIIDMYDQYDFLDHLLSKGVDEWTLPQDDRSIKENTTYTMALSGCADGEITSSVYYADFVFNQGVVTFLSADFPVEYE